jgi:hypothetical protein
MELRLSIFPKANEVFFYVHLGGLPINQFVKKKDEMPCDLVELKRSSEKEGCYCIFRCICGDRGCDSIWIDVQFSDNKVIWKNAYGYDEMGERGEKIGKIDWPFYMAEYLSTISKAMTVKDLVAGIITESEPGTGGNAI